MNAELRAAVAAELIKVRRAVMLWASAIAFLVAALVGAFFMFVLQDPARARSLGLLGTKAQLSGGTADWAGTSRCSRRWSPWVACCCSG